MRFIIPAAALALLTFSAPVQAQTPPSQTTTAPAPTTKTGTAPRTRQTLAQRFDEANTTKDGHLTPAQASAAKWTYISRNFDAIDKDHKGFVTADDIRGYAKDRRAARQQTTKQTTHG